MRNRTLFSMPSLFFIVSFFFLTCNLPEHESSTGNDSSTLPNIVFLLIDDLGTSSVPIYDNNPDSIGWTSSEADGSDSIEYEIPNLLSFSQEARVYTNMYATSLCAPSRGLLITGRYPFRNGMVYPGWHTNLPAADYHQNNYSTNNAITSQTGYLNTNQVTYPQVLRAMGYQTAFGGKWNLRWGQEMCILDSNNEAYTNTYVPDQAAHLNTMGFDSTFGPIALVGNTIDYYPPQLRSEPTPQKQYLPDSLLSWMTNQLNDRSSPQYIHYCFGLIHDPYACAVDSSEYGYAPPPFDIYDYNEDSVFADKMIEVDLLVGKFVDRIDSMDNVNGTQTLIIIAGDNGTENTYYSKFNNSWVVGGKDSNKSYGSRVPFMVRWPNVVAHGIDNTLADFSDIFPTMVELVNGEDSLDSLVASGNPGYLPTYTGGQYPTESDSSYVLDGQSLLYEMTNGQMGTYVAPREGIYTQYQDVAFLANQDYQLAIEENVGFYKINFETLSDSTISTATLIPGIGQKANPNPFTSGTVEYNNYESLVNFYNTLFPNAD